MSDRNKFLLIALLVVISIGGAGSYIYFNYAKSAPTTAKNVKVDSLIFNNTVDQIDDQSSVFDVAGTSTIDITPSKPDENLNPTEKLARDMFTQYMNARKTTDITTANVGEFAADYVKNVKLPEITTKIYTRNDITIIPETPASISQYRKTVTDAVTLYWPKNTNELAIMQAAFENGDMTKLAEIKTMSANYTKLLNTLAKTPTPNLVATLHVNMLTTLAAYIGNLQAIANTEADPVSTLGALRNFMSQYQQMFNSFTNLQEYFVKNTVL